MSQTFPCEVCRDPLPSLLSTCLRRECLAETTAADRRDDLKIEAIDD